jgi:hypothetical protein
LCHFGEASTPEERLRSSQSNSIAFNFSAVVISLRGIATCMYNLFDVLAAAYNGGDAFAIAMNC